MGLARRAVDFDAARLQHLLRSEDVIPVAHQDAGLEAHPLQDFAGGRGRVGCGLPLWLHNDGLRWNIVLNEVRAADAPFGVVRIAACAAGIDQNGRQLFLIEIQRVIEARPEDGRRPSAILGRAEHQDGILILAHMAQKEVLRSPANPLLKDVRRAIVRGGLTSQGLLVAETFHLLEEALRSNLDVKVILAAESVHAAVRDHVRRLAGIRLAIVDDALFHKLADTESSQGVITLAQPPSWNLEQTLRGQSLVVILDGLQDPGNAGTIVRASEAFGATGVLFLKGTVSPFNPKTLRASAGSLFRVPFVLNLEAELARAALQQRQIDVYAAVPHGAKPLSAADLKSKCALVIGSEGHGVSEQMRCGAIGISIPTAGVESLNAAVAAGILLYEAQRQRLSAS